MAGLDPATHVFGTQVKKRGCSGQARAGRFWSLDARLLDINSFIDEKLPS
jgi:hypothetical protein